MLLHVPEGTESAPVLQRLPGMHHRPFRGILGAALLLAGLGPDLQPFYFREKALTEERQAKRRMVAEAFAAGGAHTVDECEAMLREVGDDQALADAALRIAKAQGIDLLKAARLAVQGGQPLVEQIRAGDFAALPGMRMQVGWGSDFLPVEAPRIEKSENTLSPAMKVKRDAWFDAALHPAGRCTCGGGGGGTCEWCRMDQHRAKREERKRGRAVLRRPVAEMKGDPEPNSMLQEGILAYDRARKRLTRRAKQARKARRGW